MSGDPGLKDEPILFYSEEMTVAKLIFLEYKGIDIKLYKKVIKKLKELWLKKFGSHLVWSTLQLFFIDTLLNQQCDMKKKDPVDNYFECISSCDTDSKECHNECTEELKENDTNN